MVWEWGFLTAIHFKRESIARGRGVSIPQSAGQQGFLVNPFSIPLAPIHRYNLHCPLGVVTFSSPIIALTFWVFS